jgi:hypothetical protein
MIHDEIGRQRPLLLQRIGSMHTRASILVTASGVVSVLQAKQPEIGWQYLSVSMGVAAAVLGLFSLRPKDGVDAMASQSMVERLEADVCDAHKSIVDDAAASLDADREHLNHLGKPLGWGYGLLAASLLTSIVISAFHYFNFI